MNDKILSPEIMTFGCRLNIYESEVIRTAIQESGEKDIVVFNTCAVTKEAERQARQSIRKFKKLNPNKKLIVTGCAAQINPKQFSSMIEVDRVIGNTEKFSSKYYQFSDNDLLSGKNVFVEDIMSVTKITENIVENFDGKTRAYVQVQNGCNHRCTFCTIPFGRGNSRSVPMGQIVSQIKTLVDHGYNEIVLTGVDITDYGLDLPGSPSLGQMIRRMLNLVPNLKRLRLSSIDVAEIDKELSELIKYEKRLMPHLHISLQSGDNIILKRMKRRHNREQVIEFCNTMREYRKDLAYGADIIAGFPTETDDMFNNSLNLIKEAGLQFLHVFPYSERDGTAAARMPQININIRKERAALLRRSGMDELKKFTKNMLGSNLTVIIENDLKSRAENFVSVILEEKDLKPGNLVNVTAISTDGHNIFAKRSE